MFAQDSIQALKAYRPDGDTFQQARDHFRKHRTYGTDRVDLRRREKKLPGGDGGFGDEDGALHIAQARGAADVSAGSRPTKQGLGRKVQGLLGRRRPPVVVSDRTPGP